MSKPTVPVKAAPSITTIRKASTKSVQGKTTLTYHIGTDDSSALYWKLASSTGAGVFDSSWKAFKDIQKALSDWEKERPITSLALKPLFKGSVNSQSFLLACLVKEGILLAIPDNKRHYTLAEMDKLKAGHSKPSKAKPNAKAKPAHSMSKGKAKPATGK
jgi:hypothetical protein